MLALGYDNDWQASTGAASGTIRSPINGVGTGRNKLAPPTCPGPASPA